MEITAEQRQAAADKERAELRDQAFRDYADRIAAEGRRLQNELEHIDRVHAMRTA